MNRNTDLIPFALPSLGKEEEEAVIRVLRSNWLTTGRETLVFEKEFASFLGVPKALAVNSATAGLHLSLEALGIRPGDRVITCPFTFTASAEIVRYLAADIRFADIDSETFTIHPQEVERILKEDKTCKAIIPIHLGGYPCDMEALCDLSEKFSASLVEDAAHSFPSRTEKGYLGTLGKAGVFSFYATKTITTGEGGMIVTADETLAKRISTMRLHGIDRDVWDRYTSTKKQGWEYRIVEAGYKYNMTDLSAALGRVQLTKAELFNRQRREIAEEYNKSFSDCGLLIIPKDHPAHSWHLYILQLNLEDLTITRGEFINLLAEEGIGTSVHYIPLHIMPYYRSLYGHKPEDFPNSLKVYTRCVSLPVYPSLKEEQRERIIRTVLATAKKHHRRRIHGGS